MRMPSLPAVLILLLLSVPSQASDLFQNPRIALPGKPRGVALGDVDGDGLRDVVVGISNPLRAVVIRNLGQREFAAPVVHPLGPSTLEPLFVGVGDTSGDGRADIVIVQDDPAMLRIVVLPGQVGGGFQTPVTTTAVGGKPRDAALGDVNGDGRQDVVIADSLTGHVAIFLGATTPGTFQPVLKAQVGAVRGLAVGNLDGDSFAEIVACTSSLASPPQFLHVLNFQGSFQPTSWPCAVLYDDLELADFDGDGLADLIGHGNVNPFNAQLRYARNAVNSGAWFHPEVLAGASTGASGTLAAGDFDADGKLDPISIGGTQSLQFWPGNGAGGFGLATVLPGGEAMATLATADLDSDGGSDVAFTIPQSNAVGVLFSEGSGPGVPQVLVIGETADVDAKDVDRDGSVDVLVGSTAATTHVAIHQNVGGGAFVAAALHDFAGLPFATDVEAADLDADGAIDLQLGGASSVAIARGLGGPAFAVPQYHLTPFQTMHAHIADFDRDGDLDGFQTPLGSGGAFWVGDGAGGVTPGAAIQMTPTFHEFRQIAIADLDGDGALDVAAAAGTQKGTMVIRGKGSTDPAAAFHPSFKLAAAFAASPGAQADVSGVDAGDLDGDGLVDLVASQFDYQPSTGTTFGQALSVYRGAGGGAFQPGVRMQIGNPARSSQPADVLLRDLDADGDLDAIVLCTQDNEVAILRGTGTGSFLPAELYATNVLPRAVAAADLDDDGDVDLAVAGEGGVRLLFNRSGATAAPEIHTLHPAALPAVGGVLTIGGERLSTATSVVVNGVAVGPSGFTIDGDDRIRLTPPVPAALGTVSVSVVSAAGASNSASFDFVAADPPRHVVRYFAPSSAALDFAWGHLPGRMAFLVANANGATFSFGGKDLLQPLIFLPLPPLNAAGAGGMSVPAAAIPTFVPFHTQFWTVAPPGDDPGTLQASPPRQTTISP